MLEPAESRFDIAKRDIEDYFERSDTRVFKHSDLSRIFKENKDFWRLGAKARIRSFIEDLLSTTELEKYEFRFPSRREVRYQWGNPSLYEVMGSINSEAYMSHYSAASFHGLTEQIPKTLYLNVEQAPPPRRSRKLIQESVDTAFRRKVRVSSNTVEYRNYTICLLNCMGTDRIGVHDVETDAGEVVRVSGIERTLLDISVRPVYSGGVHEVLKAYREAKDRFSADKLASYLKQMDFIYPYHQVIGFYMEKAGGYSDSQIGIFEEVEMPVDFYLTHAMLATEYSPRWKLFHPVGM